MKNKLDLARLTSECLQRATCVHAVCNRQLRYG